MFKSFVQTSKRSFNLSLFCRLKDGERNEEKKRRNRPRFCWRLWSLVFKVWDILDCRKMFSKLTSPHKLRKINFSGLQSGKQQLLPLCPRDLAVLSEGNLSAACSWCTNRVTRLGDFLDFGPLLKPLATINLSQSPLFLGNFCKGVKIYHISSEIIFGNFHRHLAIFVWSHCSWCTKLFCAESEGRPRLIFFWPAFVASVWLKNLSLLATFVSNSWQRFFPGSRNTLVDSFLRKQDLLKHPIMIKNIIPFRKWINDSSPLSQSWTWSVSIDNANRRHTF